MKVQKLETMYLREMLIEVKGNVKGNFMKNDD